jgi:glutamate carboxypeptidase
MRMDAAVPSQGCCDGSHTLAAGVPNIDTLGIQGGKIHSSDEFMHVSSFTERAKLSTLILLQLADGALDSALGKYRKPR